MSIKRKEALQEKTRTGQQRVLSKSEAELASGFASQFFPAVNEVVIVVVLVKKGK